ncbi:MAG: hypothetical protein ACLQF0_16985 [Dissulfurispiraceae bacterium]
MTTLNRKVKRETAAAYRGRNIVIQLEPPSIIRVKEKGRRTWYETTVEAVFSMAAKQTAERIRKERKEKRQTRRTK